MKFIFPIVLVIALAAFALGTTVKNSFVLPFSQVAPGKESSDSAEVSSDKGILPGISGESAPAASANSGKSTTQNGNTYTSSKEGDIIKMTGNFNLSSYKLGFTFNFPKNGGDITGSVSGTCEGTITGKAETPGEDNQAFMHGQYSGNCKPIPTLGFKTKALGDFEGTIKYSEGKAGVIYMNKEPFETRGYFELFF